MNDNDGSVFNELEDYCEKNNLLCVSASAKDFIFEESVKMNCYYCGRHGQNWRCPPHIPEIDYKKLFSEFENLLFVYSIFKLTDQTRDNVRYDSTNHIHKSLLAMEKILINYDKPSALSFIGGSCKLCKNGCGADRCNNPYQSRMPLEATGLNIVKTVSKYGINIRWPVDDALIRIGLLAW